MGRISKKKKDKEASVHEKLKGLDLKINEFGEITGNKDIEEINKFLDEHVRDKKLEDRSGEYGESESEESTDEEE